METGTPLKDAVQYAQARKLETGLDQVVYLSQEDHYLWCSRRVWDSGQKQITPMAVRLV